MGWNKNGLLSPVFTSYLPENKPAACGFYFCWLLMPFEIYPWMWLIPATHDGIAVNVNLRNTL